jgi:hypothetical protein
MITSDQARLIERLLFLFVFLTCLFEGWSVHGVDPYHYLREGGDALGYYQWLPGVLIENDVDVMYWGYWLEDGKWLSLFTFGVALLQLPFFLMGKLCACWFGYEPNGFTAPFAVWQLVGSAFYAGAGLVLAFRLAARFCDRHAALLAVLVLFGASNLFYYCVEQPNMSHVYSFFLTGLFVYCSCRLLDTDGETPPRAVHGALFVISAALLLLVRQLNGVVFLFPLLLAWGSPGGITGFLRSLFRHRAWIIASILVALVPWLLQISYWHHITGSWFTFTYGHKGETFDFARMVPGMVITSVRNGWWVISPVMFPISMVLLWHAWRGTSPARAITPIMVGIWLLYSAWWCWWLGGSFGMRAFVDLYALLAIPAAWMFRSILARPAFTRVVTAAVLIVLVRLNAGLSARYDWGWSSEEWTWQRFFEHVSAVITAQP